jgi:hypothetical protein
VTFTTVRFRTAPADLGQFCIPGNPPKPKKKIAVGSAKEWPQSCQLLGDRDEWIGASGSIWHILGAKSDSALVQNGLLEEVLPDGEGRS